jgi:paraquat-inducible protein A
LNREGAGVIACEFCDLLHVAPRLQAGEKAYCMRCSGLLAKASRSPVEATLALALAALMLLVLANIFPFLHFSLEGQVQENRIITGVLGLWDAGQGGLALLILFTTVLAPALRTLGLLYVLLPLYLNRVPPGVAGALRFQEGLVSWAMLDVYMLALVVALVKLAQMAEVKLELGAFCFVALFIMLTLMGVVYDRAALWERIEVLR